MWKDKYNFVSTVSINVSKRTFVNENLAEEYAAIADKYNVDRGKIDLEITESATIDSNIDILKIMYDIKEKALLFLLMTLVLVILLLKYAPKYAY